MKKTVILLILTLMMVVSGMCYAAGDGSDLNRQQKVADKFMAVLSGDAAAVTQLQVDMVPELAEKMTAANFAAKQELPFILLADPERQAIEAYDVWQEKKLYGKVSMGVVRTTYIVDEKGMIEKAYPNANPDTNAEEILAYLKG